MKKIFLLLFLISAFSSAQAQKKPRLLGICSASDLDLEPYAAWYRPGHDSYVPNPDITSHLKKAGPEKFTVKIVFGSWCGDSKRELPRMMKILRAAGFPEKSIRLIGVYDSLALYKQAPKGEEKGLEVYRVPTFIVCQKDKEIGRIVEYPAETLERDLLKIVSGQPYTYNYKSFAQINTWLKQGVLRDGNVNPRGLAQQLRNDVSRESDLNSCGYVLLMRGDVREAITVFRINVNLFPQSPNCFDSLGEAYGMAGMKEESKSCYQHVLELDPKNENAKTQLEKLNQAP